MHSYLDRNKLDAPDQTTAEISIFGNGCGEAILIHIGYNEWVVFDCCLNPRTQRPVPLEYLEQIKVNPATAVKMFLISHWHSDHIRGGAELYRNCPSSIFACSDFLNHQQMLTLADPNHLSFQRPLAVKEFAEILQELGLRKSGKSGGPSEPVRWAAPNRRILARNLSDDRRFAVDIYSLSPPDAEKTNFLSEIGRIISPGSLKKEIVSKVPNCWSVVSWLSIGQWNLLLGADMEQVDANDRGWNAILLSNERPQEKARIIKVPHHGSRNAHNSLVWRDMVQAPVVSILTPFDRGNNSPPTGPDITRLCSLSSQTFSAAMIGPLQPQRRSNTADRQLQEMAKERKTVGGKFGQVRVRFNPLDLDQYETTLIGQAVPLCENQTIQ